MSHVERDRIPAFPKNYGDEQMLPSAQPEVENKTLNSGAPPSKRLLFPILTAAPGWLLCADLTPQLDFQGIPPQQVTLSHKSGFPQRRQQHEVKTEARRVTGSSLIRLVQDTTPAPNLLKHRKKAACAYKTKKPVTDFFKKKSLSSS